MAILIQYANGIPGVKFSLDKKEITIGRALDNDISIDDEFVSKYHAVIQLNEDSLSMQTDCVLIDNNSTNHTYVNSKRITAHRLDDQDKIYIGQNEFRISYESVSPIELGRTQHGFFDDDAPGLMHASVIKSNAPTSRLDDQNSDMSELPLDAYVLDDISETETRLDNLQFELEELPTTDDEDGKKRFSRRLSLL